MDRSFFLYFSLFLFVSFFISSCGGPKAEPKERFAAFQKAVEQEHWEKAFELFSSDGRDRVARQAFLAGVFLSGSNPSVRKKARELMKEHGIPEGERSYQGELPLKVKEKRFLADMTELMLANDAEPLLVTLADGELEMQGKLDQGVRKGTVDLGGLEQELLFRKEAGKWRMEIPHHGPLLREPLFQNAQNPHRTSISGNHIAGLRVEEERPDGWRMYEADSCLFIRLAVQSPDLNEKATLRSLELESMINGDGDTLPLIQGRENGDLSKDLGYQKARLPRTLSLKELPMQGKRIFLSSEKVLRLLIPFKRPSSGIERIEKMEGSFALLCGGEMRNVTLEAFSDPEEGDTLHHELLNEKGFKVIKVNVKEEESLSIRVHGPVKAMGDMKVVNGKGEQISEMNSVSSGGARSALYYLKLTQPIGDKAKLEVEVQADQKSVRFPFCFEGVEAP